jgi:hypothetical protein
MTAISAMNDYGCGVTVLSSDSPDAGEFAAHMARAADKIGAEFALIFFSQTLLDAQDLTAALALRAPSLHYAGCSTAGEITPFGTQDGQMLAILFPSHSFKVATTMIRNISGSGLDSIAADVCAVRRLVLASSPVRLAANTFALSLIDGLSHAEEAVTSAVNWGLDGIPLVGGSSGDGSRFETTTLIRDGAVETDCAIIILIATDVPFQVFQTTNYAPSDRKLVVTASNTDSRIVYEFNAAPAVDELAEAIGISPTELTSVGLASHPVGVQIGGEYYCRSIQHLRADGSLEFACAIDDGVVLSIARPLDMVETTRNIFDELRHKLGRIDVVLGFDCALRRLDAENRQVSRELSELYRANNVVGFGTYGEQFRTMHLNQTLTGIAFGQKLAAE